jgi:hypothetical protein
MFCPTGKTVEHCAWPQRRATDKMPQISLREKSKSRSNRSVLRAFRQDGENFASVFRNL